MPGKDPTPEEIAKACAEFQASWTPHQRRLRIAGRVPGREGEQQRILALVPGRIARLHIDPGRLSYLDQDAA